MCNPHHSLHPHLLLQIFSRDYFLLVLRFDCFLLQLKRLDQKCSPLINKNK